MKIILKDKNGKQYSLEQTDHTTLKKTFNGGHVNLAHDCNETGYYFINGATLADPFGPYAKSPTNAAWFLLKTMVVTDRFKYQKVIWDSGEYYRGTYTSDDGYTAWMTESFNQLNIDILAARLSALENKIGGVLTRLYHKLCATFTSLEVA